MDFSKSYDRIDHDSLWTKLESMELPGKFTTALKSLYGNVECCVKINGVRTGWIQVKVGLKQGCLISPMLFSLYINDLAQNIKQECEGIQKGDHKICLLMHADYICLISEKKAGLQKMLDILNAFCIQ